jgi:hypothetical protein
MPALSFSFVVMTDAFIIQGSGAACITGSVDLDESYSVPFLG